MNRQLRHISVVALVLLAALVVSTTYWQTWAQADLAARKDNSVSIVSRLILIGSIHSIYATSAGENR